ncbi:MAG TPA: TRAP transporter substrate-binding protein DctP [Polyangia bacterium]|nr:TRAP transporter substrate-binding protein DctP [Polyangia bacterium]
MRVGSLAVLAAALATLATTPVAAQPAVWRVATVAPDGTSWSRELRAWARDVESVTEGALHVKLYFGGIAGDEATMLDRIRRDQLDGAFGSELCTQLAPTLKVGRVIGVFQSREENAHVLGMLRRTVDAEFLRAGFINFGEAGLGVEQLFSREPVRDMATMRRMRWWIWSSDEVLPPQAKALGLTIVRTPLADAARAYDEHRFDGFITIPSAALAFQWSAQVRYVMPLRISFRSGCFVVATRAFDALPGNVQMLVKSLSGKLNHRIEEIGRREDEQLLGGLLQKQGLTALPEDPHFRAEFYDAAQAMRPGARVVSDETLAQVLGWLADFRALHSGH